MTVQARHVEVGDDCHNSLGVAFVDADSIESVSGNQHVIAGLKLLCEHFSHGRIIFGDKDCLFVGHLISSQAIYFKAARMTKAGVASPTNNAPEIGPIGAPSKVNLFPPCSVMSGETA